MEISRFTFQVLFIFIPGIISTITLFSLIELDKDNYTHKFFVSSLLLGTLSYILLNFFKWLFAFVTNIYWYLLHINSRVEFQSIDFFRLISDNDISINVLEVFLAIICGVLLSLILSYLSNMKILVKHARRWNITNRYDELDVWSYMMNSKSRYWIRIRDLEHDLIYEGWPVAFSSTHKENELLLSSVKVFRNSNAVPLYDTDFVYISLVNSDLVIELQKEEKEDESNKGSK